VLSQTNATDEVFNSWDAENRLVAAVHNDDRVEYRYNADGLRVASVAAGQETRYLVDANRPLAQVLLEYTPGGLAIASYTFGRQLISQVRSGAPSFYLADGLGSVRALASLTGSVTDRYVYDAFGATTFSQGATPNHYRYLGEQTDPFTGLIYLRARHLDPRTGRFISRDSFPGLVSDPLSLHRYVYAAGDPINRFDPTGQFSIVIEIELSFSLANILRGVVLVVGGIIGYDEGGLPGMVIGALSGAFLLGRLAVVSATEGAPLAAKQVTQQIVSKGSSCARGAGVKSTSSRALGRQFSYSVVPVPAFVQIFRNAGEEPNGSETLRVLRQQIDKLVRDASNPYTAEFYQALAASLSAADGSPPSSDII
jgi:RHS repeat-associated protein